MQAPLGDADERLRVPAQLWLIVSGRVFDGLLRELERGLVPPVRDPRRRQRSQRFRDARLIADLPSQVERIVE